MLSNELITGIFGAIATIFTGIVSWWAAKKQSAEKMRRGFDDAQDKFRDSLQLELDRLRKRVEHLEEEVVHSRLAALECERRYNSLSAEFEKLRQGVKDAA